MFPLLLSHLPPFVVAGAAIALGAAALRRHARALHVRALPITPAASAPPHVLDTGSPRGAVARPRSPGVLALNDATRDPPRDAARDHTRGATPRALPAVTDPYSGASLEFLDGLDALPRAAWLALGQRQLDDGAGRAQRETAAEALEATIVVRRLEMTAWLLRDAVETAAQLASTRCPPTGGRRGGLPPCTPAERRALAAARQAAERAALAHLVRPWLRAEDYARLVAPFAERRPGAADPRRA